MLVFATSIIVPLELLICSRRFLISFSCRDLRIGYGLDVLAKCLCGPDGKEAEDFSLFWESIDQNIPLDTTEICHFEGIHV